MTVAKQARRGPPPGAAARNIGRSSPLGATVVDGGVNFSLFSRNASGVELLFFDREDDATPSRVIRIDPATNRTYHYWHVFVPGVRPGQIYGYRVDGPSDPRAGCGSIPPRFCSIPMAGAWSSRRTTAARPRDATGDNAATAMKSVVVDPRAYDWEGDAPLQPALVAHHHLRDARPRLHPPSEFRGRRDEPRHVSPG